MLGTNVKVDALLDSRALREDKSLREARTFDNIAPCVAEPRGYEQSRLVENNSGVNY